MFFPDIDFEDVSRNLFSYQMLLLVLLLFSYSVGCHFYASFACLLFLCILWHSENLVYKSTNLGVMGFSICFFGNGSYYDA